MSEAITTTTPARDSQLVDTRQKTIKSYLDNAKFQSQLRELAGKFMTPEAMCRLVLMATSRNQDLLKCSPESIMRCLMDAAQLKIQPGGLMGRGFLVPRFNSKIGKHEASFDPGWRGLADIARRSGQIQTISAHVVYANDKFQVCFGTDEKIVHEPCLDGPTGPIIGAYAVAKFKDGSYQVEFVSKRDLDKIKAASKAKFGPWFDWEDEQCRKTAFKRLSKYLPFVDELDEAIEMSNRATGADFTVDMTTPVEPEALPTAEAKALAEPTRTVSLRDQMKAAEESELVKRVVEKSEEPQDPRGNDPENY